MTRAWSGPAKITMPCSACGVVKHEGDFQPGVWRKNHRRGICKACLRVRCLDRYHNGGEKETMEARRQRRMVVVNAIKAERGCRDCHEHDPACLDFHHRDPNDKTKGIGYLVACSTAVAKLLKEIDKCDVVCANCHRKLHWETRRPQSDRPRKLKHAPEQLRRDVVQQKEDVKKAQRVETLMLRLAR